MPRLALLLLASSLTCTGVLVGACSGAETQEVLLDESSSGTSTSDSGGTSSGSSGTSGSTTSSGSTGTSGTPGTTCESENEPNDSEQAANVLNPARCGSLSKDDQKDFLTFRLKPTTRTLSITFTGRVRLRIDVPGKDTVELTPDSAGVVPFVMDQDYSIEVTRLTDSSGQVPWRVAVIEKQ
jgi:hypothetical protein